MDCLPRFCLKLDCWREPPWSPEDWSDWYWEFGELFKSRASIWRWCLYDVCRSVRLGDETGWRADDVDDGEGDRFLEIGNASPERIANIQCLSHHRWTCRLRMGRDGLTWNVTQCAGVWQYGDTLCSTARLCTNYILRGSHIIQLTAALLKLQFSCLRIEHNFFNLKNAAVHTNLFFQWRGWSGPINGATRPLWAGGLKPS